MMIIVAFTITESAVFFRAIFVPSDLMYFHEI
jgi:hypothetical protein